MPKPEKVCAKCDERVFATPAIDTVDAPQPEPAVPPLAHAPEGTTEQDNKDKKTKNRKKNKDKSASAANKSESAFSAASLWTLPIRPLLKRKCSAERLRRMDAALAEEKYNAFKPSGGGAAIVLERKQSTDPAE